MEVRKISRERCMDVFSNGKEALKLDIRRAQFIVKKKDLALAKSYRLGAIWNILDPLFITLVYLFIFSVVRYRPEPGSVMIGLALIRGMQTNLTYGSCSILDYTAGLKIERVRTRAIVIAEMFYVFRHSIFTSVGTIVVLFFLNASWLILPVFPIMCILNGLTWYALGKTISPIVIRIPDVGKLVTYFGRMMFFLSPAVYSVSQTTGIHREFCRYNPFSYFSEPSRAVAYGETGVDELIPEFAAIALVTISILLFVGLKRIDKQRWEGTVWS